MFLFKENKPITKKMPFLLPSLPHAHSILMWFIPEPDSFSSSPGSCQDVCLVNGENQCNAQAPRHDSFLAFQELCDGNHCSKLQFLPSGCVSINGTQQGLCYSSVTLLPQIQCLLMKWRFLFVTHACLNTTILFQLVF